MTDFWTDERTAFLRDGRIAGMSATQIGMEIGASRSAVLGKAHRLKLDGAPRDVASRKPRSLWSPDDLAVLRSHAEAGLCAAEIAERMGRVIAGVVSVATREKIKVARFTAEEQAARLVKQRERDRAKKKRRRHKLAVAKVVCKPGTSKTSAIYRAKLPHVPEMTKGQLRAFLAQACANTAEAARGSV